MSFLRDSLVKFSQAYGISGFEDNIRELFIREVKKFVDEIELTPLGSVIAIKRAAQRSKRGHPVPRVLIEAHMDEIGFIVTGIENGFIRFATVGSFDARVLPSQNVMIHGRKRLPGVIGMRPPHVIPVAERKKPVPLQSLFIDVGMPDARVRECVNVGDPITLDRSMIPLRNNHLSGKSFDDRSALAVLLDALRQLQSVALEWDLYAVANVNEEQSSLYVGALTSTFQIKPELAIAIDVTYAEQPGVPDVNVAHLGEGPNIAMGANIHPFVHRRLVDAATSHAIPYRVSVYAGDTQTNAWMMQVVAEGVPTGLLEIPLRYMHTSVEMLNLNDLERTAELIKESVASLKASDHQALQGETFVRVPERKRRHPKPRKPMAHRAQGRRTR